MKYRVTSGDLSEEVDCSTPSEAVSAAVKQFEGRRKRFVLADFITVETIGEKTVRFNTRDTLKKIGKL